MWHYVIVLSSVSHILSLFCVIFFFMFVKRWGFILLCAAYAASEKQG